MFSKGSAKVKSGVLVVYGVLVTTRDRRRVEMIAQIKRVAAERLAADGAAGLSLRAVARDLDIAVSALYRYFPGRDDLLTELLVDAFEAQAQAVEEAVRATPDPVEGLRAAFDAYRAWSVAHPAEFGLAYGAPVPGYRAPGERTIRAATRVGDLLFGLVSYAHKHGRLSGPAIKERATRLDPATAAQLAALTGRRAYDVPPGLAALTLDAFVRIHGFVVMEVFGQLRPITPDADAYFRETVDQVLASFG